MSDVTFIILTAAIVSILQSAVAQRNDTFPSNCTCGFKPKLVAGATQCKRLKLTVPDSYPTYEEMGFTEECLPSVPAK